MPDRDAGPEMGLEPGQGLGGQADLRNQHQYLGLLRGGRHGDPLFDEFDVDFRLATAGDPEQQVAGKSLSGPVQGCQH